MELAGAMSAPLTSSLSAIGFDADDTLWRHADFYVRAEERLAALLAEFDSPESILLKLREIELRNLPLYGFGVKGFTLSMIETAIAATGGRATAALIGAILENGRELLRHPVEILPGVRETLEALKGRFRLVLITKGDLLDQERKLEESGLAGFFDAVEIVSEKSAATYALAFARHADGPERAMMVGDSLKSDVLPAIEAGAWGVHAVQARAWAVEHAAPPVAAVRFRRIERLGDLVALAAQLR
jgi:putative hydrolase of the HAD superfamily